MITISTFNIQNDIKEYNEEKTNIILDYLKKYKIDILSLQEVYSNIDKDLKRNLKTMPYSIYGKYRFLLKHLLNRFNEKTPIITNYKVLSTKTYQLPCFPSLLRRIMTKLVIEENNQIISIYNTHIDFQYELSKKRQLKKILKIIKKDKNPIILTGDFNLKTNHQIFQDFINELKEMGIKHINIGEKTFKASKYHRAIDHIFVSNEFTVKKKELITDIPISDHYPIIAKLKYDKQ